MKKQKSQTEALIPSFVFAVCPFSVWFSEAQNDQFSLYFQKSKASLNQDVQILNKFKMPQNVFPPNKLVYFSSPENIEPFRILSERNLSYKWSLYHLRNGHEEHIQSQNFDLSPFWLDFMTKKEDIKPYEVVFKKMKCRLFCLVAVGTIKSMELNFKQYFLIANSDAIKRPRLMQNGHLQNELSIQSNLAEENSAIFKKKEKQNGSSKIFSKEPESGEHSQFSLPQVKLQNKESYINKVLSTPPPLLLTKTSSHMVDKRKSIQEKPIRLGSKIDTHSYLSINEADEAAQSGDVANNSFKQKLSSQQVQIANQIQSKIKEQDQNNQLHSNSKLLSLHRGTSAGGDQMLRIYCLRKANKLTGSQRLSDKGEILVTPFYYHFKYYVIIIAIIIIFVGLILHNPQTKLKQDSHVNISHLHKKNQKKGKHFSHVKHAK